MNVLVCFESNTGNDCLTSRINCDLEEAKRYYIENKFSNGVAKAVIDIEKSFTVVLDNLKDEPTEYTFSGIEYDSQIDFRIALTVVATGHKTAVEPAWFFANKHRIITQDGSAQ